VRRLLLVALAVSGCVARAPPADFVLRIAVVGPLAPLAHDTRLTATTFAQDLVYEQVLRPEGAALGSRLLARYERDARGIKAYLAPGRRFSDGSPVEVEDLVRSIRAAGLEAEAAGDGALEVLAPPDGAPLEARLALVAVFRPGPQGDLGTGPYRLVSASEHQLVVERVKPVPGRIGRVELVSTASIREAFAKTLKGETNAVVNLEARHAELAEGVPGLQVVRGRGPHAAAIILNAERLGPAERRQIAEALPLAEIEEVAQGRSCEPPPEGVEVTPLPPGAEFTLAVATLDGPIERAGLAVRRGLGARGGTLLRVSAEEAWTRRASYDLIVNNVLVWPPSISALYWKTGAPWNWTHYSNPAYDESLQRGDYAGAEAALARDPPVLLLCRSERIAAVDSRIRNPSLGAFGLLETLPDWEVVR